jgi:hypothetical protein
LIRKGFLAAFFVVLAFGSDNHTDTTTETVVAHDEDVIPLHASIRETTLIVLPASEKAMSVFCGDKTYWNVDVIPGAERYVAVKPSKTEISTDIHIVTDHNNRIVSVWEAPRPGVVNATTVPQFLAWKGSETVFNALAAEQPVSAALNEKSGPIRLSGKLVTSEYLRFSAAQPRWVAHSHEKKISLEPRPLSSSAIPHRKHTSLPIRASLSAGSCWTGKLIRLLASCNWAHLTSIELSSGNRSRSLRKSCRAQYTGSRYMGVCVQDRP